MNTHVKPLVSPDLLSRFAQIVGERYAITDPATLAVAPVVLALAALAACLLPARKAVRVNPLEALRAE